MKNFQIYYEPYCSSWLKWVGAGIPVFIAQSLSMSLPSLYVAVPIIGVAYHAHNLYAEYQYNKSLEAELKVEINGEIHTVKASPKCFNWYTAYNALFAVKGIIEFSFWKEKQELIALYKKEAYNYVESFRIGFGFIIDNPEISKLIKVLLPIQQFENMAWIFKLISLQDYHQTYNFTDMKTGMPISSEVMKYLNILDVKYINVQDEQYFENSPIDDPISCDHIHELEIDNPVMEAAA